MTDITVAQAAIIEDHVWALMEALGVRDSRTINQRISEAVGIVLDRQRDALPPAASRIEWGPEVEINRASVDVRCEGPCLTRIFKTINGPDLKCVTCGRRPVSVERTTR